LKKLPKDLLENETEEEEEEEKKQLLKIPDENKNFGRSNSTSGKVVKKNGKE
jgi:hypothetical protein